MAHMSSAASVHAARTLIRHFDFAVKPESALMKGVSPMRGLQANYEHISVIIDLASQAFVVARLRPEVVFIQIQMRAGTATAPKVASLAKRLIEALEAVPQDKVIEPSQEVTFDLPVSQNSRRTDNLRNWKPKMTFTKAAKIATQALYQYYDITPRNRIFRDVDLERMEIVRMIDVCLNLRKALKSLPILHNCFTQLRRENATQKEVDHWMREVGIFFEYLPSYDEREEEQKLLV